uniref:Uncharacterized protein n=1 Tax=Sphaerodactylus townsendi TaxID=933632 RepID=A0ACB8F4Y7_9SAUR
MQVSGDISGVHIIADGMIIAASGQEEHDAILKTVVDMAQFENIRPNPDKIRFTKLIAATANSTAKAMDYFWER